MCTSHAEHSLRPIAHLDSVGDHIGVSEIAVQPIYLGMVKEIFLLP